MIAISSTQIPPYVPPASSVAARQVDVSQGKEAAPAGPDSAHNAGAEAETAGKAGSGKEVASLKAQSPGELTPEEEKRVQELRRRDQEVRAHEQAHIAAGGRYVRGGASFEYATGPDGKKYAIGGEVSIDTTREKDPEATIRKMETVIKAALAPARPSSKDRSVAASAQARKAEASVELAQQRRSEKAGKGDAEKADSSGSRVESSRDAHSPSAEPAQNSYRSVAGSAPGGAAVSTINLFV